jgi:hypothetical protein
VKRIMVLILLLATGCATLPPPHEKLGPEASPEQRMQAADQYLVSGGYWTGYRIGESGRMLSYPHLYEYLEQDGGADVASRAKWTSRGRWAGLAVVLGSLLVELETHNNSGLIAEGAGVVLGGGAIIALDTTELPNLVRDFNGHLADDFGLPRDQLRAEAERINALGLPNKDSNDPGGSYAIVQAAWLLSSDYDFEDYFAPVNWTHSVQNSVEGTGGFGYVWSRGLGIEGGLTFLAGPEGEIHWPANGLSPERWNDASMSQGRIYLSPVWVCKSGKFFVPGSHWTLGVKLGLGYSLFSDDDRDSQVGGRGSLQAWAVNPVISPFVRWNLPTARWSSLGIEFGYDWNKINSMNVDSSTGTYAYQSGTLKDRRGADASFDLSGPYVALTLEMGRLPFTH